MTEQHECVWDINFVRGYAFCVIPLCEAKLDGDEVAARLNEYEKLKAELKFVIEASEANNIEIVRLNEVIETYRKSDETE